MPQTDIGLKYDKIAEWWNERHFDSDYGVVQFEKAVGFANRKKNALDVGCGAGGRFINRLERYGYRVTGLDASAEMIRLARHNHPSAELVHANVAQWETEEKFDFILAWDSLFHLPFSAQEPVLKKLCQMLSDGGILIHSFGDAEGEHSDQWHGQEFPYGSIGIDENLRVLLGEGMSILHVEIDQFPEKHVYAISRKNMQHAD